MQTDVPKDVFPHRLGTPTPGTQRFSVPTAFLTRTTDNDVLLLLLLLRLG